MLKIMDPIFEHESWEEWETLSQPTLLVLGQAGAIDSDKIARMREVRPGARCVTIKNAGHDMHLDQPRAWFSELESFLATAPEGLRTKR